MTGKKLHLRRVMLLSMAVGLQSQLLCAANGQFDDVALLKSRDESIQSYTLEFEFTNRVTIGDEQIEPFNDSIRSLHSTCSSKIKEATLDVLNSFNNGKALRWTESNIVKRGEEYKITERRKFNTGRVAVEINQYDKERYIRFRPSEQNQQVDIYDAGPPLLLRDLKFLRVNPGTAFWDVFAFQEASPNHMANPENTFLSGKVREKYRVPGSSEVTVFLEYDSDYRMKQIVSRSTDLEEVRYFFGDLEVDNYRLPAVVFYVRHTASGHELEASFIKNVRINPDISDTDLAIQVPLWATTVDHRTSPPRVSRLLERPDMLLSNETMFSELEDGTAANKQSAEAKDSNEVPYVIMPVETKPHSHGENSIAEHGPEEGHMVWPKILIVIGVLCLLTFAFLAGKHVQNKRE